VPGERAHLAEVDRLLDAAAREAVALGFSWVGPDEFLLAILALDDHSVARAALEGCGIRRDEFADALKRSVDESDSPSDEVAEPSGMTLNPAGHELIGRAEGLAAGLGAPAVSDEHVLIAYLWDASSAELEVLCGVTREAVMDRLRSLGVAVPSGHLPSSSVPRPQTKVFIPYSDHMRVVTALISRLPRDSRFGFNHDGRSRAWVVADWQIDLEAEVAEVLGELGIQPEPPSDEPSV
jgi:hypothetical protein